MSKPNIWIFGLEPIDSRYTAQWHSHIPKLLEQAAGDKFNVRQIDGTQRNAKVTTGAFLNFSDTNYWKSSQLCNFVELLDAGEVTATDKILVTDAWNPAITQLAYMRDLLDMQWEMHGIWHAGAYDPSDILGYKMQKPWPLEAEGVEVAEAFHGRERRTRRGARPVPRREFGRQARAGVSRRAEGTA